MAAGAEHTVLVVLNEKEEELVYTFGSNQRGQLGVGTPMLKTPEPQLVCLNGAPPL
jgi:alpha-tubulin suppressor-like RCC1 family protein